MGFSFKKVAKSVSKIYDSTVGDIINPSNKIVRDLTGLSNTQQAGIGAGAGLLGGLTNGTLAESLGMSGNNGILSTIFGSGSGGSLLGDVLGSVVKGAVGIGADYFSNQQYYKDQRKLNEQKFGYDRQLADEAYQRDVAMWNMQNAYNAPGQQMERLQQAGLNPNLVYGSGNVTGNTAGSPPSYRQVEYPSSQATKLDLARNILGIFDDYQRIKNQALDNQRQNARMALQAQALDQQNEWAQKKYELALMNLGLRREQLEYMRNKPDFFDKLMGMFPKAYNAGKEGGKKLADLTLPTIFDTILQVKRWWNRPLEESDDVPELF